MSRKVAAPLLLFSSLVLLAACDRLVPPAGPERQLDFGLRVEWDSTQQPTELVIEYWIQNLGQQPVEFEFRNSGRVCGIVRDPAGREILRFPEMTAQVVGRETLNPIGDRTFAQRVPRPALGEPQPGAYEVEAWLCGYAAYRSQREFALTTATEAPPAP